MLLLVLSLLLLVLPFEICVLLLLVEFEVVALFAFEPLFESVVELADMPDVEELLLELVLLLLSKIRAYALLLVW